MTSSDYVPQSGDLVWTNFDPRTGREQSGFRPALVLSLSVLYLASEIAIVCPIATKIRSYGSSVLLPAGLPIQGEILTSHLRSIDTAARPFRFAGAAVPSDCLAEVRAKLAGLCGIPQ